MSDDKKKEDWSKVTEEEWRRRLSEEAFEVTRHAATEKPFTGEYCDLKDAGTYECVCCGKALLLSEFKFDSGCGWPSFFKELPGAEIVRRPDHSHNRIRTEILCGECGAHLGHVFQDGPPPTGERYCVNSVSMRFRPLERGSE